MSENKKRNQLQGSDKLDPSPISKDTKIEKSQINENFNQQNIHKEKPIPESWQPIRSDLDSSNPPNEGSGAEDKE